MPENAHESALILQGNAFEDGLKHGSALPHTLCEEALSLWANTQTHQFAIRTVRRALYKPELHEARYKGSRGGGRNLQMMGKFLHRHPFVFTNKHESMNLEDIYFTILLLGNVRCVLPEQSADAQGFLEDLIGKVLHTANGK